MHRVPFSVYGSRTDEMGWITPPSGALPAGQAPASHTPGSGEEPLSPVGSAWKETPAGITRP